MKDSTLKEVLNTQVGGTHYSNKKIQPIEYIMSNELPFCEGNIVKYATRHKDKNGYQDVMKIIQYASFILAEDYNIICTYDFKKDE